MLRSVLKKLCAAVLVVAGLVLVYFSSWLTFSEIVPQVIDSGWSLKGSNLILNHDWRGNQLYVLVFFYAAAGFALILLGRVVLLTRAKNKPVAQIQEFRQ
jgi:hypothetical protein